MALVRQRLLGERIADPRQEVRDRLIAAGLRQRVKPGYHVGITAGSRAVGGFVPVLNGICDAIREAGGEPFLFPAMGSHGGATAEGQVEVLRRLGVNEETVDAPIRATMDTVELGVASTGARAHLDRLVAEADGVIVFGRPKAHPKNTEDVASGLLKMTTVGLGKQAGAREAHWNGLWESVKEVPRVTFAHAPVLFGVSVVENGYRDVAAIEVVPGNYDAFLESDRRLLEFSKRYFAELPFQALDVLIVDRMGKDVAGTGMDLNVIGSRHSDAHPPIRRIVPLALTPESLGNGIGFGLADFTTERAVREFDPYVTAVNILTASEPGGMNPWESSLPFALPCDRDAVEVALYSAVPQGEPRVCRIEDTSRLGEFWVSPALLGEVAAHPDLTILEEAAPMVFDGDGNLRPFDVPGF